MKALSPGLKTAVLFAVLLLLSALVAWLDPRPSLRHVQVSMLSGAPTGNYFATVDKLAAEAARRKGRVRNLSSAGSAENVERLIAGAKDCSVHFALVQNGIAYPDGHNLELIGRLPRPESLVILGRNADRIRAPVDLKGLRMGIGPVGSGTEQMMRRVLKLLAGIDLVVSTQPVDQQLGMLERGELDLAAMVIDEEATLLVDAVARRNLQIMHMSEGGSIARHLPFARVGQIDAGQMDFARTLPREDKKVLQVDVLIVGNGCARDGVAQGFLSAVAEVFPTFISFNKGQPNRTGLPLATVAANFYAAEGPDLLGKYAPWAVDIMPLPTWIQLGVAISALFSAMAVWHRFHVWRIDVNRVKIEREMAPLLLPGVAPPSDARARIDELTLRLRALSDKCRRQSLSIVVPMGAEILYRYQEALIADRLRALKHCRERSPSS